MSHLVRDSSDDGKISIQTTLLGDKSSIEYATYYRFRRARLWRTKCVEDLPTRHGKSVKARRMILKLTFMANDTATQQVTQIVEQAVYQLEQLQQQEQLARFNARYELH